MRSASISRILEPGFISCTYVYILIFQVRLPKENNDKYLRLQIHEQPKTFREESDKKKDILFCVAGTYYL